MALNFSVVPNTSKNKYINGLVSASTPATAKKVTSIIPPVVAPVPLTFSPYVNNGVYKSNVLNNTNISSTTPSIAPSVQKSLKPITAANVATPAQTYGVPGATPLNSPAKDAYIKSVAGQSGSSTTAQYASNPISQPTSAIGLSLPSSPQTPSPITGNTTTPSGAVVNATTGQTVSGPAADPNQRYTDAYNQYINSLLPSSAETQAQKRLSDLNLQAQRDQEQALNSGETSGFASGEAARVNRNNQFDIDAASNALSALTGTRTATTSAAKARADFEQSLLGGANEPIKIGNSLVQLNPQTGQYEPVYSDPTTSSTNAPSSYQEYQLSQQDPGYGSFLNQTKTPAGSDPNRVLSATEAQALNVPFGTTASQAYGSTPQKPLTESQAKDLTYANRGTQSNSIIDTLSQSISGYNPLAYSAYSNLEKTSVGNGLVPDEFRQVKQAERDFLNAVLRRESGASISSTEFSNGEKQYFPQPGDDAGTLAQKAKNRSTAIASFQANIPSNSPSLNLGGSSDTFSNASAWK